MKRCKDCVYCNRLHSTNWFTCECFDNYATLGKDKLKKAYRKGQVYRFNSCNYFKQKEEL